MSSDRDLIVRAIELEIAGRTKEAISIYESLAERGNGNAAHNLGVTYRTGGVGISPDIATSNYWLRLSTDLGFESQVSSDPSWFEKPH